MISIRFCRCFYANIDIAAEPMGDYNLIYLIYFLSALVIYMLLATAIRILLVKDDANYIKMEIGRATYYEEYRFWKRELKRLYLSRVPFIGNILCKIFYKKK